MHSKVIQKAQQIVSQELSAARALLKHWVDKAPIFVKNLTGPVLAHPGKNLRPLLTLLTAGACQHISKKAVLAAAALTAVHEASLMHDDVIDQASLRRSKPSLPARHGNKQAILLGDYLLARMMEAAAQQRAYTLLDTLAGAVRVMAEGELEQLTQSDVLNKDNYYSIIYKKTAILFGACCKLGSWAADAPAQQAEALKRAGEHVGMAFQIQDDCLDYTNIERGKTPLQDLKQGKVTLPLLYAFSRADVSMQANILRVVRASHTHAWSSASQDHLMIRDFVRACGALEAAEKAARRHSHQAHQTFQALPASAYRDALCRLVRY